MRWAVVVRNIETRRLEIIEPDSYFDDEDPLYGEEVHIVPTTTDPTEPADRISFGCHEFKTDCACHPKLIDHCSGRKIYTHQAAVN